MSSLQFACPHCRGAFQIEPSLAGQQVACPTCGGLLLLPPAVAHAVPPPFLPPGGVPQSPPPFSPPPAPQLPAAQAAATLSPPPGGTGIVVRDTGAAKIVSGDRVIELRRLTPEEKETRRLRRTLFMLVLGLALLVIALLFLVQP